MKIKDENIVKLMELNILQLNHLNLFDIAAYKVYTPQLNLLFQIFMIYLLYFTKLIE
jgi:hypothetical protein